MWIGIIIYPVFFLATFRLLISWIVLPQTEKMHYAEIYKAAKNALNRPEIGGLLHTLEAIV